MISLDLNNLLDEKDMYVSQELLNVLGLKSFL